ncbi:MAG: hypothetical protein WAT58_04120 [Candidatus Dormiibacterota bacterium]
MPRLAATYPVQGISGQLQVAEGPAVVYDTHREADIDLSQIREARRHPVPDRFDSVAAADEGVRDFLRMIGR